LEFFEHAQETES